MLGCQVIVSSQFPEIKSNVGVDVGLRTAFSFSNGLTFTFREIEEEKEIKLRFDFFMRKHFENYHFFVEDYLLTKKMKYPIKKACSKIKEKKTNNLVDYFLKNYKDRITFVNSIDSSKECSSCGFVAHENVANLCGFGKNKVFRCILCQKTLDRDLNASRVILKRGENGKKT